jgi:hypothetical protein
MDEDNRSKKNLYAAISWVIIAVYILINFLVITSGVPLMALIIALTVVNILLLCALFYVGFLYNKANSPIKHKQYLNTKSAELPIPKYGEGHGSAYVPNLQISTELFNQIDTAQSNKVTFDITMKGYLKPKHVIIFHDEMDYGTKKTVVVSKVTIHEKTIEASFAHSSD